MNFNKLKKFYLVLDTEATNGLTDSIVYDIGYMVIDRQGRVYEQDSVLIKDILVDRPDMMKTAYYYDKMPLYREKYKQGKIRLDTFHNVKWKIRKLFKKYPNLILCAYNTRFDLNALNTTCGFTSQWQDMYFFPYGIEVYDIWGMARDTICKQKSYKMFCDKHEFKTKRGALKTSAEIVYRYMKLDHEYIEEHTGLEDVKIEAKIMLLAMRQGKKMRRHLWKSDQLKFGY